MSKFLISILTEDKLTGDNFTKWKINLNTILALEDLKFVLTEKCPHQPAPNVARSVREQYDRWIRANEKTRDYLLASMSDVLAKKHEPLKTAYEIHESVQSMFGQPSDHACYEALKAVINAKMKDGESVREHVLQMMLHFNVVEINGVQISERSQVNLILRTLPKSFMQFTSNYFMNNLKFTLNQLLNELQTFESLIKDETKSPQTNVVIASSSGTKKRKKNFKTGKGEGKTAVKKFKKAKIERTHKGKCFHCNVNGHWKRNCPKYLEKINKAKKDAQQA